LAREERPRGERPGTDASTAGAAFELPRRAADELLQLRKDYRTDPVEHGYQRLSQQGSLIIRPQAFSLIDDYVNATIHFHIHYAIHIPGNVEGSYLCSTFYWPSIYTDRFQPETTRYLESSFREASEGRIESAVLVDVRELPKQFENVDRRILPTVEGLQFLNDCLCWQRDAAQKPSDFLSVLVGVGKDGELGRSAFTSGIDGSRQSTDRVVKSRAQVVEYVSDQDSDAGRQIFGRLNVDVEHPKIRVEVLRKSVRASIEEWPHFILEGIEVFACPVDLCFDPQQREGDF
jgi:hypothetical protein